MNDWVGVEVCVVYYIYKAHATLYFKRARTILSSMVPLTLKDLEHDWRT